MTTYRELVQRTVACRHADLELGLSRAREQEPFVIHVSELLDKKKQGAGKKDGKKTAHKPSENRKANGQAPVKPKKRRQAKKPKQELQVILKPNGINI